MFEFIIKSILCLGILFLIYLLFLKDLKTFKFNRYFLLSALVFSLFTPFVSISMNNTILPTTIGDNYTSFSETIELSNEFVSSTGIAFSRSPNILFILYVIICIILLTRFCTNLFSIIKQIQTNSKESHENFTFVFAKQNVLPHTFLRFIMLNADDYKNGRIDESLIRHEIAHSKGLHSIDILIIELLKIFCWFNPFIWLLKKPMQLNHEYLADHHVLSNHDCDSYKKTLINLVLTNNQGILISNFNFSLTKQRLKMMTKHISPTKAIFGKFAAVSTFLLTAFTIACNQESLEDQLVMNANEEWWQPILKAHNIEPAAYNNFERVFEMGTTNSINDGIVTLEEAFVLIKRDSGYLILKSPLVYHDLKSKTITSEAGTMESYIRLLWSLMTIIRSGTQRMEEKML